MNRPRRRFGQNFLQDQSVIDNIIDAIDPKPDQHLVEIGPGKGALTLPLLESGCRLDVIELDRDLAAQWQQRAQGQKNPTLTVHSADALKFDFSQLDQGRGLRLVGNLPYNISTPLLFHILQHRPAFSDLHVMLQKEVADRICAKPGNKTYGRLTIMLAPYFDSEALFDVPPEAFIPVPQVTSTVLSIQINEIPKIEISDHALFTQLVKQAFSQRRKTLRKSLRQFCDESCFSACDIDSSLRPEVLPAADFARMANFLSNRLNLIP